MNAAVPAKPENRRAIAPANNNAPRSGVLIPRVKRMNDEMLVQLPDKSRYMNVQMDAKSNISYMRHTIGVRHDATERLLDDTYDPISMAFFNLSVIMQAELKSHQLIATGIVNQLDKLIDELNAALQVKLAEMAKKAETVGVEPPMFHGAEKVHVQVIAPRVIKFLTMVETYDQILVLTEAMWWGSQIDDRLKMQSIREWRNHLKKFVRRVNLINDQVRRVQRRLRSGEVLPTEVEQQIESVAFLIKMVDSDSSMQRAITGKSPRRKPQKKAPVREISVEDHLATRQPSLGAATGQDAAVAV